MSNVMSDVPETIYLDNAATTPVLSEVARAMGDLLLRDFGNPSSRHRVGLAAEGHLRRAREVLARRLGAEPAGIIFTSGGTEANALALLGSARRGRPGKHLLISSVEHPSLRSSARMLADEGFEVEELPVTPGGWVDPAATLARLRPDTALVAVMAVNNETGVAQPVAEIAAGVRAQTPRCRVLVDGVQALGSGLPLDLHTSGAHMISASAHKVGGPKGVGCLALAQADLPLAPLWGGGEQERGRRSGTENLAGIVGFARAVELCRPDPDALRALSLELRDAALARLPGARVVGDEARRAPHILCVAAPGLPTEVLVNMLEAAGVCASSGSACHSRSSLRRSHVMKAMGVPAGHGVLRFSLSGQTTAADVQRAARLLRTLDLP